MGAQSSIIGNFVTTHRISPKPYQIYWHYLEQKSQKNWQSLWPFWLNCHHKFQKLAKFRKFPKILRIFKIWPLKLIILRILWPKIPFFSWWINHLERSERLRRLGKPTTSGEARGWKILVNISPRAKREAEKSWSTESFRGSWRTYLLEWSERLWDLDEPITSSEARA